MYEVFQRGLAVSGNPGNLTLPVQRPRWGLFHTSLPCLTSTTPGVGGLNRIPTYQVEGTLVQCQAGCRNQNCSIREQCETAWALKPCSSISSSVTLCRPLWLSDSVPHLTQELPCQLVVKESTITCRNVFRLTH